MKIYFQYLAVFACIISGLIGCRGSGDDGNTVVLYSSVDQTYTLQVIDAFEKETGVKVKLVSDTEAAKSTGLMNRLVAEKSRPVADVFWSGDPIRAQRLVSLGVGEPLQTEGVAWRFRLVIVNTDKEGALSNGDGVGELQSVFDLAKPEFASKSCIANPQFGTTSMHLAVLYEVYGEARVAQFLEDFSANGGKMVASNGEVRRRVSSGEYSYGLTDSDDYSVALSDRKPVDYIIPDQDTAGVLAITTVPVKIKQAPHSALADQLVDFLLSDKVEEIMASSEAAHIPVNKHVPGPEAFNDEVKNLPWMKYDKAAVVERMKTMSRAVDLWVSEQQ